MRRHRCAEPTFPRLTVRKGRSAGKRLHARKLNLARRHLTSEKKREVCAAAYKENPNLSARQMGEALGIDHKTAASVKRDLVEIGEIPQSDFVEHKGGGTYPVKTVYIDDTDEGREAAKERARDITWHLQARVASAWAAAIISATLALSASPVTT
jgi:hypothetical protein